MLTLPVTGPSPRAQPGARRRDRRRGNGDRLADVLPTTAPPAAPDAAAARARSRCGSSTVGHRRARRSGGRRVHRGRLPRDRARASDADRTDYGDADSLRAGQVRGRVHGRDRASTRSTSSQANSANEHARRRRARDRRPRLRRRMPKNLARRPEHDRRPRRVRRVAASSTDADVDDDDHRRPLPRRPSTRASSPSTQDRRPAGGLPEEVMPAQSHSLAARVPRGACGPRSCSRSCSRRSSRSAAAYWTATRKVAQVPKVRDRPAVLEPGGNYLLIGSDSRAFVDNSQDSQHFGSEQTQTGQRSDTIMVAHVEAATGSGFLVSFPRDLWVDIPGIGHAKINAAFNAGPQRVIETIEQDFDVPISHYLQVDFAGFRKIVNALGTIPIYFPTPARDVKSGLYITKAGCQQPQRRSQRSRTCARGTTSRTKNGKWQLRLHAPISAASSASSTSCARSRSRRCTRARARRGRRPTSSTRCSRTSSAIRSWTSPRRARSRTVPRRTSDRDADAADHRQFFDGQDALVLDTAKAEPILPTARATSEPKAVPVSHRRACTSR